LPLLDIQAASSDTNTDISIAVSTSADTNPHTDLKATRPTILLLLPPGQQGHPLRARHVHARLEPPRVAADAPPQHKPQPERAPAAARPALPRRPPARLRPPRHPAPRADEGVAQRAPHRRRRRQGQLHLAGTMGYLAGRKGDGV
ncbi:hypothetical protein LTR60_004710, partial [Cryomyces antarcticus]